MPEDTEFLLLSRDKDIDHIVELLQVSNRSATRHTGHELAGRSEDPVVDDLDTEEELANAYAAYCLNPHKANPKSKKALRNSIKTFFQKQRKNIDADGVIRYLVDMGIVEFDTGGKPIYYRELLPSAVDDADDIPF